MLHQCFIFLIVSGAVGFGQLPTNKILIILISVSLTIPLISALVQDVNDFIQEFSALQLEAIHEFTVVIDPCDHENNGYPVARDHNFQRAVTR